MALALYRKYRPRTFAEVIGQEHVTEPLAQALRTGRLHHAYLFSGPRGCGKTSSARILARSLNCAKGPTPDPCGECDSCVALAPDGAGSIDVIEIDAASHGGVDDARDLRERAFFAPAASRFKVYVIDEAHMVSSAGFNALLKLVEEPPEYVKFVFATTEPEKVLGTIKSRTHHYPFRLIPPGVLRPYLEKLCQTEGVAVEPTVFPLVVQAGGGSARDSLSVLDQLISGAGPEGVTYQRAVALLGVTDAALLDVVCDGLAASDGAAVYQAIDSVLEAGHDPRRFAGDLLMRLRDLIVLQKVPDAAAKGLLDYPEDQLERMSAQAGRLGPAMLTRCAGIVHDGLTEMRGTTAPRLLLELICARMLLPGADESTGALLQRMERLERRLGAGTAADGGGPPPAPAPPARQEPEVLRTPPPPPAAEVSETVATVEQPLTATPGAMDAAAIRRVWDEVLTTVRGQSQRAWAIVREATVREVDGDTLVLQFQHEVHADMLAANPKILSDAVTRLVGGTWNVRCEFTGGQGAAKPAAAPQEAPAPRQKPAAPARQRQSTATKVASTVTATRDEDWPAAAVPGGAVAAPPQPAPPAPPPPARPAPAPPPRSTPPPRPAAVAAEPPEEPGFDPGDEPLDDAQPGARESSEEQAIRLLREHLGAERID